MKNKISIKYNLQQKYHHFLQIIQKSFENIFPIILIGALAKSIGLSCFSKNGFFANIYNLNKIIPPQFFQAISSILSSINDVTTNIISIFIVFFITEYTANLDNNDDRQLSGISGIIFFLLMNYNFNNRLLNKNSKYKEIFFWKSLGMNNIFLAIILGTIIGIIFKEYNKSNFKSIENKIKSKNVKYYFKKIIPLIIILILGSIINFYICKIMPLGITHEIYSLISIPKQSHHHILNILKMITINNLMCSCGLYGPLSVLHQNTDINQTTANLNYAIVHHSLYKVPYPISMHTLYYTYATFGGNGMVSGLIISILLFSKNNHYRKIAKLSILPNIFNINGPLLIGIPIILNPYFIIPFLLSPIICVLIPYVFIKTGMMPPAVYPIPPTTPEFLSGYLGTNCNIVSLLVSLLNIIASTAIYTPFVKLIDKK